MHGYLNGHYLHRQSAVRRASPIPPFRHEATVHYLPRDVSSRFGLRLRELRRARNMTQLRMAVDFGIDRSYISDVERGRKSVSLPTLEIFALGLKLSLSDLLDGI
jgi:DNA-binding XRE family transcriptional regulator